MDCQNFDNTVKTEKIEAIAKYRRFRTIAKFLRITECFVAFTLLYWSSKFIPNTVKIFTDYLSKLHFYLFSPIVVFLIGNAIIITLFALSGTDNDEMVSTCDDDSTELLPPANDVTLTGGGGGGEIVCSENENFETECEKVAMVIEKANRQIKRFERTQSEKLKREIKVKLRRSETDVRRTMTPFETVESLSNEQFRRKVEAFIEKHKQQRFRLEHKMDENINNEN